MQRSVCRQKVILFQQFIRILIRCLCWSFILYLLHIAFSFTVLCHLPVLLLFLFFSLVKWILYPFESFKLFYMQVFVVMYVCVCVYFFGFRYVSSFSVHFSSQVYCTFELRYNFNKYQLSAVLTFLAFIENNKKKRE